MCQSAHQNYPALTIQQTHNLRCASFPTVVRTCSFGARKLPNGPKMEHIKATFGPALFRNKEKQETPEKKGAKPLYDYSRLSEHIIKLHTGCENIYTKSEVISLPLSHTQTHTYRSSLHSGMVPMVGEVQSERVSSGMVTRCQGLSRTCGQGMGKTRMPANTRPHERHKSK